MGHSDFETTEFYYIYISDKRKKKEFERAKNKSLNELEDKAKEEKRVGYTGKKLVRKKVKAPIKISA